MNFNKVHNIYFLGIGGIGMSALARYFKLQGKNIYGYDHTATPLTQQLESEGMQIHYSEDVSQIPSNIDLVIFTPAIPKENQEFYKLQKSGITMMKRAEVIGELSKDYFTIAIAGTHGKTSISAIAVHLLKTAGLNVTAFIGGICLNYQSNFIHSSKTGYLIVEADEYDRSFLQLHPEIAVISSMDADHLDVYKKASELENSFRAFVNLLSPEGKLIYQFTLDEFEKLPIPKTTYGNSPEASVYADNIRILEGQFSFDLISDKIAIRGIKMQIPGHHYIENALAAASIGIQLGLDENEIRSGLESFKGVERRFEVRINKPDCVFIDDYAHHPEEIRATIRAVRLLYPEKKLTVVFQPHLFSRTRDFVTEFAKALAEADHICLLNIYPAREKPITGVSSEIILEKIENKNKELITKQELEESIKKNPPELLLTMGAGDIGLMVDEIENLLLNK